MSIQTQSCAPQTPVRSPKSSLLNSRSFAIPEASSQAVLQDLLSRFHSFKSLSSQVTDWYHQAWSDVSEELSVLVETQVPTSPTPKYEDLSREFQIKGSVFEGLFAAMKRAVMGAEALIRNYCFKRRGKYSETECKKGVGVALDRMANEIWKLVSVHVQKPVSVRAAEALKALASLQKDTEVIVAKLKEAQNRFEEVLYRHLKATSLPNKDQLSPYASDSLPLDNPFSIDVHSELRDQSSKLMYNFHKYAASGTHLPAYREIGSVLRDMAFFARTSAGEAGKEEGSKLARQLVRMRNRVEGVCRTLEATAGKKAAVDMQEYEKLKSIVSRQEEEIAKLRQSQQLSVDLLDTSDLHSSLELDKRTSEYRSTTPDPTPYPPSDLPAHVSYQISPAEPAIYRDDLEKISKTQIAMLSDLKSLHIALEKATIQPFSPALSTLSSDSKGDFGLGLMLKAMRAAAPHITAENNAEVLHQFVSEMLDLKESVRKLVSGLQEMGWEARDLREIEREIRENARQFQELREEHGELMLKVIKTQSEAELDANSYQKRIKELERQLEDLGNAKKAGQTAVSPLKGLQGLLAALPKLAQKQEPVPPPPSHRSTDSRAGFFEDEIAYLSAENFALMSKLQAANKDRSQLLDQIDQLESQLHQQSIFPLHSQSVYIGAGLPPVQSRRKLTSADSVDTEGGLDLRSGKGGPGSRFQRISILESLVEEGSSD